MATAKPLLLFVVIALGACGARTTLDDQQASSGSAESNDASVVSLDIDGSLADVQRDARGDALPADVDALPADAPTDTPTLGEALSFNGFDQYVVSANPTPSAAQGTVELWAYLRRFQAGPNGTFLFAESRSAPGGTSLDLVGLGTHPSCMPANSICFGIYAPNGWKWAGSGVVPIVGSWYHFAGTWGPAGILLYVNGQQMASQASSDPTQPANVALIGSSSWAQSFAEATIDEVRAWNIQRSASDILSTMNVALTGSEPGLLALWHFDEGSGLVAHDSSPQGNDGRLASATGGPPPQWVVSTAP